MKDSGIYTKDQLRESLAPGEWAILYPSFEVIDGPQVLTPFYCSMDSIKEYLIPPLDVVLGYGYEDLAKQFDAIIIAAIKEVEGECFTFSEEVIKQNAQIIVRGLNQVQDFYWKGKPLLRFHPYEFAQVGNVIRVERKVERLSDE